MKKLGILILLLTLPVAAQWQLQHPKSLKDFTDVFFSDDQNGWIIGEGSILRTIDQGENWTEVFSANYDLRHIFFVDSAYGWISDYEQVLLKTTDGGLTWKEYNPPVYKVFFLNRSLGYGTGIDSAIYKTTNGGDDWLLVNSDAVEPTDLFFTSDDTGFVVSGRTIYKTTDGGFSWNIKEQDDFSCASVNILHLHFINSSTGFLVKVVDNCPDIFYYLLKTTDGGETWEDVTIMSVNNSTMFFTAEQTGWIVDDTWISITTDGGLNWSLSHLPLGYNRTSEAYFIDNKIGFIVGSDGTILKTTNGGSSWNLKAGIINSPFWGGSFVDENKGWVVGNSIIAETSDGGADWFVNYYDPEIYFTDISFLNRDTGFATGMSNKANLLLKTTDAGANWVPDTLYLENFAGDILLHTDSVIYLSGLNGFYKTTDNGNSWDSLLTSRTTRLFYFLNSSQGWVVTDENLFDDTLHYTSDGGVSWLSHGINVPKSNWVSSVFFLNENTGWLAITSETEPFILKTTDGGITWEIQLLPVFGGNYFSSLNTIHFFDKDFGWCAGDDGVIFRTTNGGKSWSNDSYPDFSRYNSGVIKYFTNSITIKNHLWLLGTSGVILHREVDIPTIIEEENVFANSFQISQNYPNPFNPVTTINYQIPEESFVKIKVYDVIGKEIITLVNEQKSAGSHKINFDAGALSSGFYLYKIEAGNFSAVRKMILMK